VERIGISLAILPLEQPHLCQKGTYLVIKALPPLAPSQSLTILEHQTRTITSFTISKPTSAFVTQLLATRHAAAAFRQKRRCSPAEAQIAYRAVSAMATVPLARANINIAA
jgi:hypothetical protein